MVLFFFFSVVLQLFDDPIRFGLVFLSLLVLSDKKLASLSLRFKLVCQFFDSLCIYLCCALDII
jgi:hypothetical protein